MRVLAAAVPALALGAISLWGMASARWGTPWPHQAPTGVLATGFVGALALGGLARRFEGRPWSALWWTIAVLAPWASGVLLALIDSQTPHGIAPDVDDLELRALAARDAAERFGVLSAATVITGALAAGAFIAVALREWASRTPVGDGERVAAHTIADARRLLIGAMAVVGLAGWMVLREDDQIQTLSAAIVGCSLGLLLLRSAPGLATGAATLAVCIPALVFAFQAHSYTLIARGSESGELDLSTALLANGEERVVVQYRNVAYYGALGLGAALVLGAAASELFRKVPRDARTARVLLLLAPIVFASTAATVATVQWAPMRNRFLPPQASTAEAEGGPPMGWWVCKPRSCNSVSALYVGKDEFAWVSEADGIDRVSVQWARAYWEWNGLPPTNGLGHVDRLRRLNDVHKPVVWRWGPATVRARLPRNGGYLGVFRRATNSEAARFDCLRTTSPDPVLTCTRAQKCFADRLLLAVAEDRVSELVRQPYDGFTKSTSGVATAKQCEQILADGYARAAIDTPTRESCAPLALSESPEERRRRCEDAIK